MKTGFLNMVLVPRSGYLLIIKYLPFFFRFLSPPRSGEVFNHICISLCLQYICDWGELSLSGCTSWEDYRSWCSSVLWCRSWEDVSSTGLCCWILIVLHDDIHLYLQYRNLWVLWIWIWCHLYMHVELFRGFKTTSLVVKLFEMSYLDYTHLCNGLFWLIKQVTCISIRIEQIILAQ